VCRPVDGVDERSPGRSGGRCYDQILIVENGVEWVVTAHLKFAL
jgi:hypothetical protein